MTVQTISPTPTLAPAALANTPTLSKRFPPLADRSSLSHRLTGLSRQKLAREATARDPDVRRCLAHFRLHVASMEWSNSDVNSEISSFELEEDDYEEDRPESKDDGKEKDENELEKQMVKGPEENKDEESGPESTQSQSSSTSPDVLHVSFHVALAASDDEGSSTQHTQPPSPPRQEDGILDRSRGFLEKTVQRKHFWSPSGQCVPVSIAS